MENKAPCTIIKPEDVIASYDTAINENPANRITGNGSRKKRATSKHTKFWAPGRTLTIAFLNGDQTFKDTVKAAALTWQPHINLTFDFVEGAAGDIRIQSSKYYASAIGTDALLPHFEADKPTMWISPDYWWPRCIPNIIHEFGHVLGLEHEHLHPESNIPWDKPALYASHGIEYVEDPERDKEPGYPGDTYLNLLDASEVNFSAYDSKSIMHYEVKNHWTQGDFQVDFNYEISDADKAFVGNAYPFPGTDSE